MRLLAYGDNLLSSGSLVLASSGNTLFTSGSVPLSLLSGVALLDSANTFSQTNVFQDVKIGTAGKGLYIKEGGNATLGTGTLSGGTVTINTTKVTASSRIFLTATQAGVVNIGVMTVSAIVAGTSFTVTSSNVLDSSTFNWVVLEPA